MIRITITAFLFVFLAAFVAPEKAKAPKNLKELQNRVISTFFFDSEIWSLNKEINFKGKRFADEEQKTLYVGDQCEVSFSRLTWYFHKSIDENADFSFTSWYNPSFYNNYKRLLNVNPVKNEVKIKDGTTFRYFDGDAIQTTFNALYRKPSDKFKKIANYQTIYNFTMKEYLRETSRFLVKLMKNKKGFDEASRSYENRLLNDTEFLYWPTNDELLKMFKPEEMKFYGSNNGNKDYYLEKEKCVYQNQVLTFALRRNIDGTLPVIISCLKAILKDYDPEIYQEIKDGL